MSPLTFLLVVHTIFTNSKELVETTNNDFDCNIRYRRNWYSLTLSEQLLYIKGFQSLRRNGKLDDISHAYLTATSIRKWQDSSLFFPLHEHLTYQLENAIRSLGNEYKCFSMPYWDWSIDSGLETNAPIFNTPIGGNGVENNNYCVKSDYWNVCNENNKDNTTELCYWTPFPIHCDDTESICCLKRWISTTQILPSSIEIAFEIANNANYEQFTNKIKQFSDYIHAYIGSVDTTPMSDIISSEDPIFFLLSSYIGYIRALWSDCNDYDLIPNIELENYINAYQSFKTQIKNAKFRSNDNTLYELDMDLNEIFYNQNYNSNEYNAMSVRNLYDISELNVVYNLGTFWEVSKINTWCNGHINNNWFMNKDYINTQEDILVNNNYVNQYVNKMWNEINLKDNNNKLAAIASLSCDYVRRNSLNSCYNTINENEMVNNGICDDLSRKQLADLTVNDLYDYIGDNSNECLLKIRDERWSYCKHNILLKQSLCVGLFDYKCNKWISIDNEYDGYDDLSPILNPGDTESNDDDIEHIMPSSHDGNFFIFNTSLWSVIVWCSMFIFTFMMCCYMFTVKKDFETESIYKKNRQTAYTAIYGSTNE
eukprot:513452_1